MAEKTYELLERNSISILIGKRDRRGELQEFAETDEIRNARYIVDALNEKEDRDRVSREASVRDSVDNQAETADQVHGDGVSGDGLLGQGIQ